MFLDIVANGRELTLPQVEEIAKGRVWDGATAKGIGLVDELGSLAEAVDQARTLAGLPDAAGVYIKTTSSFLENLQQLGNQAFTVFLNKTSIIPAQIRQQLQPFDFLLQESDPTNIYAHSMLAGSTIDF
jgi:protease-4